MADLIFVLAGRENRKQFGIELFWHGVAPMLLLSVARFEIRRYAKLPVTPKIDLLELAAPVPPPQRHFFVFHDAQSATATRIPVRLFGTLSEIAGLASWLSRRKQISSLLIITGKAHMPRVRLCCRHLLPGRLRVGFQAVPDPDTRFWERLLLRSSELLKLIVYFLVLQVPQEWLQGRTG
jgi:uncharacterized SAM-binding protein YcdF (DUF218 family)